MASKDDKSGPKPDAAQKRASLWLCLIVLGAIAASATLSARCLSRLLHAQAAVTQSLLVDGMLKDLSTGMLDAEAGARGYLLTGSAGYLQPYYAGLARIHRSRDSLAATLIEDPSVKGQLDAVSKAVAAELEAMQRAVEFRIEGRPQPAADPVLADTPGESMDPARAAIHVLEQIEARRSMQQRDEHALEIRSTYWTLAGSITLNLMLLVILLLHMRKAAARERAARQQLALRNSDLSHLLASTTEHNEQVRALSELSRFLQSCADMSEAEQVLQQQLPFLMKAESGAMYLFAASRNQLRRVFAWGPGCFAEHLEPGDCWGLRLGKPYRQRGQDAALGAHALDCQHLRNLASGEAADIHCLPMVAHGDLMGLMVLDTGAPSQKPAAVDDDDHRRMTLEQVGLSIGNLRLRESLRQQSIRDELTGLYNRRFFEESMHRELLRASRLQSRGDPIGMALLMIDVDHFKRFNDEHGHDVGDRVLREVGQVLQRQTRGSDVAARYGGEEFTVLMTDLPVELGFERAEQIRAEIEQIAISALGRSLGKITISVGLAQYPRHGSTLEELFHAADKALYDAKGAGRNRVAIAA